MQQLSQGDDLILSVIQLINSVIFNNSEDPSLLQWMTQYFCFFSDHISSHFCINGEVVTTKNEDFEMEFIRLHISALLRFQSFYQERFQYDAFF